MPTERDLLAPDNFRAAFYHTRGTYFRWHGDDDWLEPEYAARVVEGSTDRPLRSCALRCSGATATESSYP